MSASPEGGEDRWTIRRVLTWTTGHFEKREIDAPRLTAEILVGHVLGLSRVRLYIDLDRPLNKEELGKIRGLIERRLQREPTQYLVGAKEFYGRSFAVDPRVLIPRPETELLVERVLSGVAKEAAPRIVDVCTGSGCIAATIAVERPNAQVWATDVSADACAIAQANFEKLGAKVTLLEGDLLAPVAGEPFDVVVSNPPYIASGELPGLMPEVRREPKLALDGGADGLDLVRRLAVDAVSALYPGGLLAMEIGETQGAGVREILIGAGYVDVAIEKDLERRDRMAFGRRPLASPDQSLDD